MNLVWQSWSDFFAMGGYGPYVWGSFAVTAVVMLGEVWSLRSARRALAHEHHDDLVWEKSADET